MQRAHVSRKEQNRIYLYLAIEGSGAKSQCSARLKPQTNITLKRILTRQHAHHRMPGRMFGKANKI